MSKWPFILWVLLHPIVYELCFTLMAHRRKFLGLPLPTDKETAFIAFVDFVGFIFVAVLLWKASER